MPVAWLIGPKLDCHVVPPIRRASQRYLSSSGGKERDVDGGALTAKAWRFPPVDRREAEMEQGVDRRGIGQCTRQAEAG